MNCKKCGNDSQGNSKFCVVCGEKFDNNEKDKKKVNKASKIILLIVFLLIIIGGILLFYYLKTNNLLTNESGNTTKTTVSTTTSTTKNQVTSIDGSKYSSIEEQEKYYTKYLYNFLEMSENSKTTYTVGTYKINVEADEELNLTFKINDIEKEIASFATVYYLNSSNTLVVINEAEPAEVTIINNNETLDILPSSTVANSSIQDNKLIFEDLNYFDYNIDGINLNICTDDYKKYLKDDFPVEENYIIDITKSKLSKEDIVVKTTKTIKEFYEESLDDPDCKALKANN